MLAVTRFLESLTGDGSARVDRKGILLDLGESSLIYEGSPADGL